MASRAACHSRHVDSGMRLWPRRDSTARSRLGRNLDVVLRAEHMRWVPIVESRGVPRMKGRKCLNLRLCKKETGYRGTQG
jgi:hypothetical protein